MFIACKVRVLFVVCVGLAISSYSNANEISPSPAQAVTKPLPALMPGSGVRMNQESHYANADDLDACKRCGNCCNCCSDCCATQAECCVNLLKGCLCIKGGRNCCESCGDCRDNIGAGALWCLCCCGWCGADHE
jgi:hypothetical protein